MSTPNEDSIGHTPEWYRRQLKIAQARIRELEARLQEAQATANEWQNAHEHAQFFAAQKQAVAS